MKIAQTTLLKNFRSGDETAFKRMYDQHFDVLYLFGLKYIPNQDVVEDIIQDAFVKVWEKRQFFFHEAPLKAFLYKTVRNACLNFLDHQKARNNYEQSVKDELFSQEFFLHSVIEEEVNSTITEAVNQLPESARLIYLLSLNGLKNAEIAEDLEVSVNTVKTQKQRATKFLRSKLKNLFSILCLL